MSLECWNEIGVFGDASCPELSTYHHCSHCPKYTEGARQLLEQEPPPEYLSEWTAELAKEKEIAPTNTFSAVLFRIGSHRFALSTKLFREIIEIQKIHTIPHRSNRELLGLTNIRGTLHLCVSVHELLKLANINTSAEPHQAFPNGIRIYPRTVVVEKDGKAWAFYVDEIIGMQKFAAGEIIEFSDVQKMSRGIVEWEGNSFDVLNEDLFFERLQQSVNGS